MIQLREEGDHFNSQVGQVIAMRFSNSLDQPFQAQSPQVVSHLSAGISIQHTLQALRYRLTQAAIADFFGNVGMASQDFQNSHEAWIGEAQRRSTLSIIRQGG